MIVDHCKGMYPREFAYVELDGRFIRSKAPVKSDEDFHKYMKGLANRKGFYTSVYSFEKVTPSIDYCSAIVDRMYFDFDSKEDPASTLLDVNRVCAELDRRWGIKGVVYFTGGKGFALYIDFDAVDIMTRYKKIVLQYFFDMVRCWMFASSPMFTCKPDEIERLVSEHFPHDNIAVEVKDPLVHVTPSEAHQRIFFYHSKKDTVDVYDSVVQSMDGQIRGDISRVSRLPNTQHQSGLYCVPVEPWELGTLEYFDIADIAKEPRTDFDLKGAIQDNIATNSKVMDKLLKNLEGKAQMATIEGLVERQKQAESKPVTNFKPNQTTEWSVALEEAKRVPISKLVGSTNKLIICPLHVDKNPSFSINHKDGVWFCHGSSNCGGGDVIELYKKLHKVDFKTAVYALASMER